MCDYWTTTKAPVHMFRAGYRTPELDTYIRDTAGVDPAMITVESGISGPRVRAYQRQLGVRKITGNAPKVQR